MLSAVIVSFVLGVIVGWFVFRQPPLPEYEKERDLKASYNEGLVEGKKFACERHSKQIERVRVEVNASPF